MKNDFYWKCPRCFHEFYSEEDAVSHTCEVDPADFHAVQPSGGVTHEPDYNGSVQYGASNKCRKCQSRSAATYKPLKNEG